MGNDPVNMVDPSGGLSMSAIGDVLSQVACPTWGNGLTQLLTTAAKIGSMGSMLNMLTQMHTRTLQAELIAGQLMANVATQAGDLFNHSDGGAGDWLELTKEALTNLANLYSNQVFASEGAKQNYLGNMFENNFHEWMSQTNLWPVVEGMSGLNAYSRNSTSDEMDDGNGSTIPGHSSRKYVIVDGKATVYQSAMGVKNSIVAHPNAAWFEVKATDRVISKSSNNYQIQYEMEALANFNPRAAKTKVAQYHIVTTAGGAVGNGVYEFGFNKGIYVFNWRPQYRINNGTPEIRFGYEVSKRDNKRRPVRRKFWTYYHYTGGIKMKF
jgi:hypothetical protein